MAALIPLRKSLLIAVSAVAALLGSGSAYAVGSAHLANDPSGTKVQRSSPVKSALGGQDTSSAYYYYYVQGR